MRPSTAIAASMALRPHSTEFEFKPDYSREEQLTKKEA
jgi:hypothetical protein